MVTGTLTPDDVRALLERFSAAIELDQNHVDGLPPDSFSVAYDEGMWRQWRHDHRVYVAMLLSTTDAIPPVMLWRLTGIAVGYEPALVGNIIVDLFAEVVSGCSAEDFSTAERFFGGLIAEMSGQRRGRSCHGGARASLLRWLPAADPLRIAQDPECGYGL
ncbi:hypothetical protein [Bradyrhizobium sp. USDA 3364]